MTNKPIGIFDSGIGGLSVLNEIRQILPNEDLVYIADSAYAPYGNKPHDLILQRCDELSHFLVEKNAKAIVVACNTASAVSIKGLREKFSLPIIAMEPGVKPAIAATKKGIVGVLATENTLASEQFTRLLHRYAENVQVICQPCPGLVEQIEQDKIDSDQTRQFIHDYTSPLLAAGADTVVLGCTHYPFIKEQIASALGTQVTIIETGQAVAQQLDRTLKERGLHTTSSTAGQIQFYTSDKPSQAKNIIARLTNVPADIQSL